jgi:hypothetical protein
MPALPSREARRRHATRGTQVIGTANMPILRRASHPERFLPCFRSSDSCP